MKDYFNEHMTFVRFALRGSWRDAVVLAAAFRDVPPPNVKVTPKMRDWFLDDAVPVSGYAKEESDARD